MDTQVKKFISQKRYYAAVTGALIATRREVFDAVNGMDEVNLEVEFNDVDFCLKVGELGLKIVCLPLKGVIHRESSTRRLIPMQEVIESRNKANNLMLKRWPEYFRNDPYHHPHLIISESNQMFLNMLNKLLSKFFRFPALHGKIERLLDYGQYLNRAQLKKMGIFDDSLYLSKYEDVAFSGCNPYVHYMLFGWRENREISSLFSANDLKNALKINTQNPIYILRGLTPANLDQRLKSIINKSIAIFSIPTNDQTVLNKGVNLIGYFSSEIGLGQAVRNLGTALDAAAISSSFIDSTLPQRSNDIEYQTKYSLTQKHHANIIVCGIPAAGHFYEKCEPGRVNYLYPFWELSEIPLQLKKELLRYEGFFAPSQFIADALQSAFNRDIPIIRSPVRSNFKHIKKASNDSILRIISFFDFDSYVSRKNPLAVLEAFLLAFPKTVDSVLLTVKVRGHNDHGARALLAKYTDADKRIIVIDKTLSRADMDQLIASSDVYISMHRSEGFGFGPAEALAMGKVVISTDYSGTKDFISHEHGFPVAYELVKVKKNEYPFSHHQRWANPSIDDAAKHLQEIHSNYEMAQLRGLKGLAFMQQHYSPQAVSKSLQNVLQQYSLI